MNSFKRTICIVLDGVGVGEAADAADFGDTGSDSIANAARAVGRLRLPNLGAMGLGNVSAIAGVPAVARPSACYGKMSPRSAGKDSTMGHWELMGCVVTEPLPLYPAGFPSEIVEGFRKSTGRGVLGNCVASGTEIIKELGDQHLASGDLIVYTSQDSVFQIAAHEDVVAPDELYDYCRLARQDVLRPPHAVGRVIARPFAGKSGGFYRTERRRDFSLPPPTKTALEHLRGAGRRVLTVGKIDDLFAGRGIDRAVHTGDNAAGMRAIIDALRDDPADFVFANLVDFDTMWGHRNDARAYALGLEEFDSFLSELLPALASDDLLLITSDHGNDPTTPSTDHTRENVPLLAYSRGYRGSPLGCRDTLADLGASVCAALRAPAPAAGRSFVPLPGEWS